MVKINHRPFQKYTSIQVRSFELKNRDGLQTLQAKLAKFILDIMSQFVWPLDGEVYEGGDGIETFVINFSVNPSLILKAVSFSFIWKIEI